MASPLVSRAPQCLSCVRKMAVFGDALQVQAGQQIRGKKKVAKATTIKVRLRRDITGFGRKGSIVPVPPGTMRNNWFPNKMAEYMTIASIKELGDVNTERDPTFGGLQEREAERERKAEKERALKAKEEAAAVAEQAQKSVIEEPRFEPEVLGPEQAIETLQRLLPPTLEFYRAPNIPAPVKKLSPSLAANSTISAAAEAAAMEKAKKSQRKLKTPIFGSVSTADIAANLKAILWENLDGARVILSPEDISFAEDLEDKDRVKHLGTYDIVIKMGQSESIRTKIEIKAQQS